MKARLRIACPFEALRYHAQMKQELACDPVVAPFIDLDNAVWMRHEVGAPLVIQGQDDEVKYFDVVYHQQNKVVGHGVHRRLDNTCQIVEEAAVLRMSQNKTVNLGRY